MYLSDIHTHSIASGHGTTCTISDMAKAASQKGLKLLGITDHGPATLAAGTSSYFRSLIYSPRKRFEVELLYGIELNILDTDGKTDSGRWDRSIRNALTSALERLGASGKIPSKMASAEPSNSDIIVGLSISKDTITAVLAHLEA